MAVNAFLSFFDAADGESTRKGKEKWVEIQGWDWEVEAESSWTSGAGASVGKPSPGALWFEHDYDTSSSVILGFICTGKAFPKVELQMTRTSSGGAAKTFLTVRMEGVLVTRVGTGLAENGRLRQHVHVVFKSVSIDYVPQTSGGTPGTPRTFNWDIQAGSATYTK